MTGHAPAATVEAVKAQAGARLHLHAPDRRRDLGRRGAVPPLRPALLAVRAHRHRRQPLRHPARPARSRAGPRSSCSTGATTAPWTRPSSPSRRPRRVARRATSARRWTPRSRPAWSSSTTPPALEAALAHGDVACVLAEPALTNVGIVHPEPGFHAALRDLTRRDGNPAHHRRDPHDLRRARRLHPGPRARARHAHARQAGRRRRAAAVYGFSDEVAERVRARSRLETADTGGIGGTLAANALATAAMRATLEHVLTEEELRAHDPAGGAFRRGRRVGDRASSGCPGS